MPAETGVVNVGALDDREGVETGCGLDAPLRIQGAGVSGLICRRDVIDQQLVSGHQTEARGKEKLIGKER